ncbi:MAG: ATP-binding protein [Chloroflexota bacterium]|nr:ATP-binding protein [Chloroflexota bacterium]
MSTKDLELSADQLRRETDPAFFSFQTTEEVSPLEEILGQERAVRSIDFGVDIPSQGYNIFAVGPPGSGRTTVVKQFLNREAAQRPAPSEWCYVYNFESPRHPKALELPAGRATELRDEMEELIKQLRTEIPRAFEGEHYEERRRELVLDMEERQAELYQDLEEYLNERNFALIRSQAGLAIAPMKDGEVLSPQAYQELDDETKKKYESYRAELQEQFDRTMRQARQLNRQSKEAMYELNSELAGFVVDNLMLDLRTEFNECAEVLEYLETVREDVVENVQAFLSSSDEEGMGFPIPEEFQDQEFKRYKVNVIAQVGDRECAPVIIEDHPTYHNLIGRIERRAFFGAMVTDFTQIRPGSLHRANGGYLVVQARDLLMNPLAWDGLERALSNNEIKIEDMAEFYGMVATATLEPEPIPLDVKVVIIGDEFLYQVLYNYDEDFRELFKIKAQFGHTMPREQKTAEQFAQFVSKLCREEGLRHFDASAVARLIDESSRLANDQEKVTTRFADVADLVREASSWAQRAGHDLVTAEDVRRTMEERTYRLEYAAEEYRKRIQEGVLLIDTEGGTVGQVNGLSVVESSGFAFGLPSRITANTFAGRSGVVSIDREVKMSGPIHDKGQLILSSYLANCFAQKMALSMSASITFEQLYSGVEGDSASSTELYALLSSLSGLPIRQDLAVTGSVNQRGYVQAIGGVNAKIEGFFDVCKARGLTGEQGVLIPTANVRHLMLRDDVQEAVRRGEFHIYAVSSVKEGIELLTGVPAGEPDEEGDYPQDSVYGMVQAKLEKYAEEMEEEPEGEEEASWAKQEREEAAQEQEKGDGGPDPEE